MVIMKVTAAAATLGLASSYRTFRIQTNSTAVFPHVGAPFTQALFVHNRCAENHLSRQLEACVDKETLKTPECYVRALQECVTLYETAGGYGASELRVITDFAKGTIKQRYRFPPNVFAEGGDIYQLPEVDGAPRILIGTWHENLVYDVRLDDPNPLSRTIPLHQEMWGLAVDPIGPYVWMTTGSSQALKYKLDKTNMKLTLLETLKLRCAGSPVKAVNELEFDNTTGTLWGNVWFDSRIYQFDPVSGNCLGILDLHDNKRLKDYFHSVRPDDVNSVWNGIAFLDRGWILYTGKLLPHVFISKFG